MSAEPQRHGAERSGDDARAGERKQEAEPGRGAVRGRQPCRCIGADAGKQHEPERGERIDTYVIEQRHCEGADEERRERQRASDESRDEEAQPHVAMSSSSSSSSAPPVRSERHSRIGMSEPNTTTSLRVLGQNDAKLSSTPTNRAPSAVNG